MRFAVIDLGTNTVRLLIADADGPDGYRPVRSAQKTTRLGQGLGPTRELQPEPVARTLRVVGAFGALAETEDAEHLLVVGTSALREAKNRAMFQARARDEFGVEVSVVSGETEARLSLLGVRAALPHLAARFTMMDIGGGSTEFVRAESNRVRAAVSTGLGVVKLTEGFLHTDPPTPGEILGAREAVTARLVSARDKVLAGVGPAEPLVGTAGTVTTLAAMDLALERYDPARVTGHTLSCTRVAEILQACAAVPLAQRKTFIGLESARADVIIAGMIICIGVMETFGFPVLTVSDGGLREGILLDWLARFFSSPRTTGPASA